MKRIKIKDAYLADILKEWKWLLSYIYKYKLILVLYIALGLLATVMSLGVSVASKYLIDAVVQHSSDTLVKYGVLVVGLSVLHYLFSAFTTWVTAVLSTRANNEIRHDIYSNVVTAEWESISRFHSGDLINRLEADVSTVSNGVINFIPGAFSKGLQFFGSLAIVLYYDKTMAFLALMSAPFFFFSSKILMRTIRKYSKKTRELNGEIISYSEESMQNLQIIKAFDLTKNYIENFRKVLEGYRKTRLEYEKFNVIMTLTLSLIGLVVAYSCYGWGVYRLWQGAITYGTMTLFLQISNSLTASFGGLVSLAPSAISIATSAGRIMEVTDFGKEKDSDKEKALSMYGKAEKTGVSVCMENLSFGYRDGDSFVLENAELRAHPGETIALVGPSGEGKTTVLKLLLGLVEPTKGELYLEGNDGEKLKISDSTRRFCSYVPQDVGMFTGTIAENLRLVKEDATDEELDRVIDLAELRDVVDSLPAGMNTKIIENGGNFSQGQLQRFAIARALLKNSYILIMDEATSALDADTERRVLENIMVENPVRVCILTTHRESMLKYCDKIYRINSDGNIIAEQ